jgi:hypothetical protein
MQLKTDVFSLKDYWFHESQDVKSERQNFLNRCIDQILDSESRFCRNREVQFSLEGFRSQIEYGDYLFVAWDETDGVSAFAIGQDHPDPHYGLWSNSVTHTHGYFEVSVICSIRPKHAKSLFDLIVLFARQTLLRYHVQLQSLDIPKLLDTYRSWGLIETDPKHHIFEFNLQRNKKQSRKKPLK